jgi:hypothetical protein
MIRGVDNKGNIILGITRTEIVGLLEGHRCCFPGAEMGKPETKGPHVCLVFAEDDDGLIAGLNEMFPDGVPTPVDYRTKREPEGER